MKFICNGQTWDLLTSDVQEIQGSIDKVGEILEGNNLVFSHLLVDGIEVYESIESYFLGDNGPIQANHVEVVLKTLKQLKDEVLDSMANYLEHARPHIEKLMDLFYQGASESGWKTFIELLESIEWMLQALPNLAETTNAYSNAGNYLSSADELKRITLLFSEALEVSDTSQIADIIQYELLPALDAIRDSIAETRRNEVAVQ